MGEPRFFDGRDPWETLSTSIDPILVTDRRIPWMPQRNERWTFSLPFESINTYREVSRAHRYAMVLEHDPIMRLHWAFAHQVLWWRWGNAEVARRSTQAALIFSRRSAKAARAIRTQLEPFGCWPGRHKRCLGPKGVKRVSYMPLRSR